MSAPPVLDANIANRSPWFGPGDQPIGGPGWYECRYWSERLRRWGLSTVRWWDGAVWRFGPGGPDADFGNNPRDQWRGRAAP